MDAPSAVNVLNHIFCGNILGHYSCITLQCSICNGDRNGPFGGAFGDIQINITVDLSICANGQSTRVGISAGILHPDCLITAGTLDGTAIDGQDITLFDDIASMLEGKKPGDTVVLSVFRRTQGVPDKELTIEVELIESVSTQAQVQNNYASGNNGSNNSGNSGNYGNYGNYGGFNPFGGFGSYFGIQ